MFCKFCGQKIEDDVDVCFSCGRRIFENVDRDNEKTKISVPKQNVERSISITEVVGIAIAILGLLAVIYCGISIRDDTIPYGLYGIRANYKAPFSSYEKSQIFKLVASIIAFVFGIVLWAVGRNRDKYTN